MYKLGNIDLLAFGLIPSQIDGSNLAVAGCWDMPARMGKTSHDWGEDADSIEPYLRAEEIRFAGRDITFVALLETETEETALVKCYDLYKQIGGINTLVDFIAGAYGTFQVYLKSEIVADYLGDGWCKLKFTFREPVVDLSGTVPAPTNAELGIDGISFNDLGIIPLDVTGRFNNPSPKNFKSTYYENEGYKVSKIQNRDIVFKGLIISPNYTEFKNRLKGLYGLFKKEGIRYITYRSDAFRDFFVSNGFQVTNVLEAGDGQVSAEVSIKFTEVSAHLDWSFLMASDNTPILDALGQKIVVLPSVETLNNYSLTVSTETINADVNGQTVAVTVTANTEWAVLESLDWANVSNSLGLGNGGFEIEVEKNAGRLTRTGSIKVSSDAGDKLITITQEAVSVNALTITKLVVSAAGAGVGLYDVRVEDYNPDNYETEWRRDGGVWGNNAVFFNVSAGGHTFEIRNKNRIDFVASKTQNIGNEASEDIFSISSILADSDGDGKYVVTVTVNNPANYGLEYRRDGGVWQNNATFYLVTAGVHTFEARDKKDSDRVASKTQNIGEEDSLLAITSVSVSFQNNTAVAIINTNNPDNYLLEYNIDNESYQLSNIFTNVSAGVHTFFVRNKNNTVQVVSKTQNVTINTNTQIGVMPKLTLTSQANWNDWQWQQIPDFDYPKVVDVVTGEALRTKGFIWHMPYRNIFGNTAVEQLTNMFRKGVSEINASKLPPYYVGMENLVTGDRIVVDGGLGADANGNKQPEELSFEAFANFAKRCFGYAETYHVPKDAQGRYKVFLADVDYEAYWTSLLTQEAANYHVYAFEEALKVTTGRYGFQYACGLNHAGYAAIGLTNGTFGGNVWDLPADSSAPLSVRGKSLASNNRTVAFSEISYAFETFLPQGYQAKDQNGNNWITINHFGNETLNAYAYNSPTNSEHWAACLGQTTEALVKKHRAYGQKLVVQLKIVNERDNGFRYSKENSQYADGKWIYEWNRYGIQYFFGDGSSQTNPLGSEYIPNFIAEAQTFLVFFLGAWRMKLWGSAWSDIAVPRLRATNARRGNREDDKTYGNGDLEPIAYTQKALYEMSQPVQLSDGRFFSFYDTCDGTEEYLLNETKVIYPNLTTVQQLHPVDWQLQKRSIVRGVRYVNLEVEFAVFFQAYGVEDSQVTYVYNDLGGTEHRVVVDIPVGEVVVRAFSLKSGGIEAPTTVSAPVITSSPSPVMADRTVVFVTTASGVISWYAGGVLVNSNANPFTVENPVAGTKYKAKRTVSAVTSAFSNEIEVQATTTIGVTIIEPNKPAYFFSDGNPPDYYNDRSKLPRIFTNTAIFDPVNDVVWMRNQYLKVGINLKRGGQICWLSYYTDFEKNVVYNGYDGGFQIVPDYTETLVGGMIQGQTSGSPQNNTNYNTTLGGTHLNRATTLMSYGRVGDSYRTKLRPLLYPFNDVIAEVEIECTYALINEVLKCEYRYTGFRSDSYIRKNEPFDFRGFVLPVCFLINEFDHYSIYTGNNPFTNQPLTEGEIPNVTGGAASPYGYNSKEYAGMVFNPNTGMTIGVSNNSAGGETATLVYEQLNKYPGTGAGTVFAGPYTTMSLKQSLAIPDGSNFSHFSTAYLSMGTRSEVRSRLTNVLI